jgi:bifunctional non-homologous end joining protein LigD
LLDWQVGRFGTLEDAVNVARRPQIHVGHVGTGFTDRMLADLGERLRGLARETSPFDTAVPARDGKDAHWVGPTLVGEVAFGEWTPDGRMRHPSWRGLRPDKSPAEVRRES